MHLLGQVRQRLVLCNRQRQIQPERLDRLATPGQCQQAQKGHPNHQCIERAMRESCCKLNQRCARNGRRGLRGHPGQQAQHHQSEHGEPRCLMEHEESGTPGAAFREEIENFDRRDGDQHRQNHEPMERAQGTGVLQVGLHGVIQTAWQVQAPQPVPARSSVQPPCTASG
ncbi:hypothetical protein DL770_011359 [Monosporascus sp. CRB-9-2]|nr:hypothetical protein DL770_011359 [Monosporascus sp. CRB-9-2]